MWVEDNAPTPAAARYWSAGHPSPPAPTTSTEAEASFNWPGLRVNEIVNEEDAFTHRLDRCH